MRQYSRTPAAFMLYGAAAMFALGACNKNADNAKDSALAADSALGRDLAMAGTDTAAQPKLQDVPQTPAASPTTTKAPARTTPRPTTTRPRTTTPAPVPTTPAPAAPASGTIAAGTALRFATNSKVCSNTNAVGDKFTATLASAVEGSNGVHIPEGATGTFEVASAKTAKNANDNTSMTVKLLSVTFGGRTYPVDATVTTASTTRVRSATSGDDAKKVVGGAVIGAIAGQVIGKSTKGTVIGAAAGAAAGTAAAAATGNYDTCLNNGAAIAVKLDESATIRM